MKVSAKSTNPNGGEYLGIGKHLLVVEKVAIKEWPDGGIYLEVTSQCVASSDPNQVGLSTQEKYNQEGKDGKGSLPLLKFAEAVKLITKAEWEAASRSEDGEIEFDENMAVGRCYHGETILDTYNKDKPRLTTGLRLYNYDDKRCKDWAKSQIAIDMMRNLEGGTAGAASSGGSTATNGKESIEDRF